MRKSNNFTLMLALLPLLGCAPMAIGATCAFGYDDDVLQNLVLPAVKAKYGDNSVLFEKIYNYKNPTLYRHGDELELIFDQEKSNGKAPMDAPFFVVVLDPCTRRVVRAFETDAWLKEPVAPK